MNRKPAPRSEQPNRTRSAARRFLERLLGNSSTPDSAQRGRLMLEALESRQLLAGDVDLLSTDPGSSLDLHQDTSQQFSSSSLQAEGEAGPDLVAFANALAQAGVTFYGSAWCPFCTQQKELFEDGGQFLPFVEVTNPDRTLNEIGIAEDIQTFPTWEFPDNSRATGVLTLDELATRAGISIPQSDQPMFAPVGDQTVEIGSPLHIGIDGYDPDSPELTVTVDVADPSLLTASVLQNNRSARITVQNWGDMVFELFEDRAPRPTSRFIELAQSGFYDESGSNQIIFHRVIDDFVLQSGDPTGTGSGGSTLGDFDDQYHPELQHNRTGILSYAKSLDDTNDSQFFITEGQQRHLDYNHSIFGQLIEGDDVREAISETAVTSSRPDIDIVIESVEIFQDTENSIVVLNPTGNSTGSTDVTITMTDPDGNTFTEVITVTVTPDAVNANPYLDDIAPVSVAGGNNAVFTLNGIDIEDDPITYEARVIDSSGASASVDQSTGEVTVVPASGFTGSIFVEVAARKSTTASSSNSSTRSSTMDLQVVEVMVGPQAPTGISLDTASDSGLDDSDGITNIAPVTFTITGVEDGATVEVLAGDTQIGVGVASGNIATVTTNNFAALGNASHVVTARQTIGGITSDRSSSISVSYDTVGPAAPGTIPSQATVGEEYTANLQNDEEGAGLRYSLVSAPTGMTIDAVTGVLSWTPTSGQTGDNTVDVRMTDNAGNTREDQFTINVGAETLVSVRVEITDLNGNVLTSLTPGQEFEVRVFGNDERLFGEAQGIYALYMDVFFDSGLAEPAPFTPEATNSNPNPTETIFTYSDTYNSGTSGTIGDGVLEEVGSFSSSSNFLGPGEEFFFSARLRATAAGTLVITTDPAEDSGHDIALFNVDDAIPVNQVAYGSASIDIAANFTAVDDAVTVNEDSTNNPLAVLDNDTILTQGTTLTISAVSATSAEGGSVSINGNTVRYTPPADYEGIDTFTYTVSDQDGNTQTATVTTTVQGVNDPPVAADDAIEVAGDTTSNLIDVLDNDSIAPDTGETLQVTSISTPSAGGTVQIGTGGASILYTPATGFVGTETFEYTISDGSLTDTATVTVTVSEANPPPTAVDDNFTITEDDGEASFDVFANDFNTDPDETTALDAVISVQNGTARLSGDGLTLLYQPAADFFGTDEVVYSIRDSNGATDTATVTFTVTAVNDPPPAPDQSTSVVRGSTDTVVLSTDDLNAINVDGTETLSIASVGTTSAGGTVQIDNQSGQLLYTPPTSTFTGTDSFTYTISDAASATTTGLLTVEVLDYTPRDFTVNLAGPAEDNGFRNLGPGFGVVLSGTDFQGNVVETTAMFDQGSGAVEFANQAPGTYEVTIPSIPFLFGSTEPQTINFESGMDDTSPAPLDIDFGNLAAKYMQRKDFASSASSIATFVAVRDGEMHAWMSGSADPDMPTNVEISLSTDGTEMTIEIDDPNGSGRVAATLPIENENIDLRDTIDGVHLFRVTLDPSIITYSAVSTSTATAEGEATLNATNLSGEGEASEAPLSPQAAAAFTSPSSNSGPAASSDPAVSNSTSPSTEGEFATGGLAAEGEAGPIDSSSKREDVEISRESTSPSTLTAEETKAAAVDSAMQQLLPQLEVRSEVADALANDDTDQDFDAFDDTFNQLGNE